MVGSHSAEYYAPNGNQVVILDNLMRSRLMGADKKSVEYNWQYLAKYRNIKRIKGDIRNRLDVAKAIGKGVDLVIHTAGQPGVAFSIGTPREDFEINALGTFNVLECLRQKSPGAALVYCSTNKVYGENVDKIRLAEKDKRYAYIGVKGVSENMSIDRTAHTPYGVSKYIGDLYVQEFAHSYGIRSAVFRMSCIYGIRQFGFEEQGWVAWFIIATLTGKPITIYGDGKQVRDVLYVTDLVNAYDKFFKNGAEHAVYNIGGGAENTMSLLEFLELLKRETKIQPKITFSDWRPSDQKVYISDIAKVSKGLNWRPQVSPREGVRRLIQWVKKHKELFK